MLESGCAHFYATLPVLFACEQGSRIRDFHLPQQKMGKLMSKVQSTKNISKNMYLHLFFTESNSFFCACFMYNI